MNVLDVIAEDLTAFADPRTEVLVDQTNAVWVQDGRERSVAFSKAKAGAFPKVTFDDKTYDYVQFLASPSMANLAKFANFAARITPRLDGYIETEAVTGSTDDEDERREGEATELIRSLATTDLPFLSTRLVLVQGEAGAGKTVALRELTANQAELYQRGKVDRLFFYVNAQGRALSRIDDAMAKDLQDLRADFPYAAVTPLTRHGLLVPIIDGFDELLGSGGYDEAFSSLAALISTLDGEGAVVASARSAFFDYRSFRENAQKFAHGGSLNYELTTLIVEPWGEGQQEEYVTQVAERRGRDAQQIVQRFRDSIERLSERDRELLNKPFYVSKVADLLMAGGAIPEEGQLLDVLVDSFLEREHEKLKAKEDVPLLSVKGHKQFLFQLADEMWWQESRRVDLQTLRTLIELIADQFGLPPESARALVARVSSYPFLTTETSGEGWYRFEHEVLYGYFLAHRLRECIEGDATDLRRFLNRAVADTSLVNQTARLVGRDSGRIARDIQAISKSLRGGIADVVGRENGGRLAAALLRNAEGPVEHGEFLRLIFKQVTFAGTRLNKPQFVKCDFEAVDFSDCSMTEPRFEGCALRLPVIDPHTTRLEGAPSELQNQVNGIELVRPMRGLEGADRYFAPPQVSLILREVGADIPQETGDQGYGTVVEERVELVDRFFRKMERRFYASGTDIDKFGFTNDPQWQHVWESLEESGLLEGVTKSKSGRNEPLYRLTVPPDIARRGEDTTAAVPAAVRTFWTAILN